MRTTISFAYETVNMIYLLPHCGIKFSVTANYWLIYHAFVSIESFNDNIVGDKYSSIARHCDGRNLVLQRYRKRFLYYS